MSRYKYLYNPMLSEFSVDYDKLGDKPQVFKIGPGQIKKFKEWKYEHIKKKLAKKLLDINPPSNRNKEQRLKEIYEIIEVNVE